MITNWAPLTMNIDARSAGPPSFVRQPAIYQQNPKELQHPSQHSSP